MGPSEELRLSIMAPRPVVRVLAVALSLVLLFAIMSTQYGRSPTQIKQAENIDIPPDLKPVVPLDSQAVVREVSQVAPPGDKGLHQTEIQEASKTSESKPSSGIEEDLDGAAVLIVPKEGTQGPQPDLTLLHLDNSLTVSHNTSSKQLDNPMVAKIPSIIHFIWCGQRFFQFKNYLSVQSIIRVLKADKLVVHYEALPQMDQLFYHQWFQDIQHDFPFAHLEPLTAENLIFCNPQTPADVRANIILKFLNQEGGVYVSENTWLLRFDAEERSLDMSHALEPETMDGFVAIRAGLAFNTTYEQLSMNTEVKQKHSTCTTISQFYGGVVDPQCLLVKGGHYDAFFPMQIWELDDAFGRLCRKIFYGTESILLPKPTFDELVPNIGHMIWLGGGTMDFVFYLSALSVLYVVEVETLYIHGDLEPAGDYWPMLKADPRVKFVLRPQPTIVYNGPIEWYYRALMSDIIRVDIMIKYGGIYTDTDAIWVKKLTHEDRGYEAVASYDWVDWSYPYPDSVNFGLSYGKKNAPFWRIFRDSMRSLHNDVHGFTGVMMPYKLLEKRPDLLRIDRRLQVICYQFRCHPTYVPNYHDQNNDHVNSNSIPNWKEDVYAFHWTHPNPPEYANKTALLSSTGMFAEIGQYVLQKAGIS